MSTSDAFNNDRSTPFLDMLNRSQTGEADHEGR